MKLLSVKIHSFSQVIKRYRPFLIYGLLVFTAATLSAQSIGTKVSILGVDGKTYTGIIKSINNNQYQVKYDGYNYEAWLQRAQFAIIAPATTISQPVSSTTTAASNAQNLNTVYEFGRQQGWASPLYAAKYTAFLQRLTAADVQKLTAFINQATTASARFFALKSLLTNDSYAVVQKFIEQLNKYPESAQQEGCLATTRRAIIQQWEFSCSVTDVQTYLADLCPRYAWEVKQIKDFDAASGPTHPMAEQQKELLEKYGGKCSPRGDFTGTSIGILSPLNELVAPILGYRFYTQQITEPLPAVLGKIRGLLDRGIDVPLLVGFIGTQSRHFLLVLRYRNTASGYQYLIYDPWDGRCDYVSESTMLQNSLSPLLAQWKISMDYYYPVQ